MTRTLLASLLVLFGTLTLAAQQSIFGTVVDENGDGVISGNVKVFKGDAFITGAATDFDGNYRIDLDPGTYNVEFSYIGYPNRRVDGFQVLVGQENKLDMTFEEAGINLDEVVVVAYEVDPMRVDETSQGLTLTSDDVKQLGTRNINAIASVSAGATSSDEGEEVSIRGGRTDATQYVIDGIRVTGGAGSLIPETEIEQIQVVTGGVEAKYGDLSGGLINITTKGPSSQFNGYVEAETSNMLDPYNQSLVGGSFSGPILTRAREDGSKQTVLGYRFSGRYTYQEDDDPPATDIFYITDATRELLEDQPIQQLPEGGFAQRASFLTDDDVQVLDAQPFEQFERVDITGKLDARLTDNIDVTLTGAYNDRSDQFTPGAGSRTEENWRLLNAHNNPFDDLTTYRGNFRFRQRLGAQAAAGDTTSVISNALYTLQFGFQRAERNLEDPRHGDNFWAYGHIGTFDYENVPTYDTTQFGPLVSLPNGNLTRDREITQTGFRRTFRGFSDENSSNPVLANYNRLGLNPGELEGRREADLIALNGTLTNLISDGVYTLHESIGEVYNLYRREKNDLLTFNLQTQFDLRPGRGKAGTHNVQLGVLYEQRINRRYDINPRQLWITASQLANAPLQNLDTNNVLSVRIDSFVVDDPTVGPITVYDTTTTFAYELDEANLNRDSKFFRAIRGVTGDGELDFVNVDALDPSQLSLDLFSAPEITSQNILDYYGYDYLGNEVSDNIAWEDFFSARDEEGRRTFPVAPIQPIYFAGYLQDKFNFRNIILRAGVRVDYYDANTKVLRDPYELYAIQTKEAFNFRDDFQVPQNVPESARVYVQAPGSDRVQAFRDEDQWYTANGRPVNRSAEIFGGTVQNPAWTNPAAEDLNYIQSEDFNPDDSFEDYEAQINVMPRLAFSFPISDDANFFAHYDVLVQRPPSNTVATALDYYYWFDNIQRPGFVANNPNLRPTRTVDYEAGFQQRISQRSALKLSFFVREMRDMVQRRTYLNSMANAQSYTTYDNQDFGTVKGLNVAYDMRRTGPVSLRLAYALQFADGTGSDANSQRGSLNRGNLRTLYPLSFDERHRVSGTIDYRYGANEGPTLFGVHLFENTGVNLFGSAVSGRPYTRSQQAIQLDGRTNEGDINGARLPWNLVANLRVDRNFSFFNENSRGVNMNVYLRVSNLLDRRNIISVYEATGEPDDDGYLATAQGQAVIASQLDQEAFVRSYQYRVLNPNFFSLPRRIYLGASFAF